MARYIDVEKLIEYIDKNVVCTSDDSEECKQFMLEHLAMEWFAPTADVAPREEVFEEVDKFRADLMNKFIDLCRGNDYNKLTLLKIGDVVDEMYDRRIAELNKKYTGGGK